MKKKIIYRLLAGMLAVAMPVTGVPVVHAAESDTVAANSQYTVLTDENGHVYDLGGIEVTIRDWWSDEDGERPEAQNEYEEARYAYLDWCQETYNFTIKEQGISDWGSAAADFVDYVTTGGDENNYIFVLHEDTATTSALHTGLMYDLSSLDSLDLTEEKFQRNLLHQQYTYGDGIYAMSGDVSEPRTGMYFNKRVLEEAGIDPDSIYDMQANGTWTWKAWTDLMKKVQRDTNGDGFIDVYGFDANYGVSVSAAVYSNGGEYVGMDENGLYVYKFEDPATVEALEWINDTLHEYALDRPAGAQWDYYKLAFLNGDYAFLPEDAYAATTYNFLSDMEDDIGFVMFPKGPKADDYVNCWSNNPYVIPACYDADRAWKIAFAFDLYTDAVPGFEHYVDNSRFEESRMDSRAVNETIPMMQEKGMTTYHSMVPNLDMGLSFLWQISPNGSDISELLENNSEVYQNYIEDANENLLPSDAVSFTISDENATAFDSLVRPFTLSAIQLNIVTTDGSRKTITAGGIGSNRYGVQYYVKDSKGNKVNLSNLKEGTYTLYISLEGISGEKSFRFEVVPTSQVVDGILSPTTSAKVTSSYDLQDSGYYGYSTEWIQVTVPSAGYYRFRVTDSQGYSTSQDSSMLDSTGFEIGYCRGTFNFSEAGVYYLKLYAYGEGELTVTMEETVAPVSISAIDSEPLVAYKNMDSYIGAILCRKKFKVTYADGSFAEFIYGDETANELGMYFDCDIYYIDGMDIGETVTVYLFNNLEIPMDVQNVEITVKDGSENMAVLKVGEDYYGSSSDYNLVRVSIEKAGVYKLKTSDRFKAIYDYEPEYGNYSYSCTGEKLIVATAPMDCYIAFYGEGTITLTEAETTACSVGKPITTTETRYDYATGDYDYQYYSIVIPEAGTYFLRNETKDTTDGSIGIDVLGVVECAYADSYIIFDEPGTYIFRKWGAAGTFSISKTTDIVEINVISSPSPRVIYGPFMDYSLDGLEIELVFADQTTKRMKYNDSSWDVSDSGYYGCHEGDLYKPGHYTGYVNLCGLSFYEVTYEVESKALSEIEQVLKPGEMITVPGRKADSTNSHLIRLEVPEVGTYALSSNISAYVYDVIDNWNYMQVGATYSSCEQIPFSVAGTYYLKVYSSYQKDSVIAFGIKKDITSAELVSGPAKSIVIANTKIPSLEGVSVKLTYTDGSTSVVNYGTYEWYLNCYSVKVGHWDEDDNWNWFHDLADTDESMYGAGSCCYDMYFMLADGREQYVSVDFNIVGRSNAIQFEAQPEDTRTVESKTAKFSVKAVGEGLTYQWMKSTDGGKTWSKSTSTSAKTDTLSMIAKLSFDGMMFKCVVTDENGITKESDVAALTVIARTPLTIKRQPVNTIVPTGQDVRFTVVATGDDLKYQWQISKDGGENWNNSGSIGATTETLTISARTSLNNMKVRCVITDAYGRTITSKAVTLTVVAAITKQPVDQSVVTGTNATFSVVAKGDTLKYQWQISKDGGASWSNSGSTGATTNTLTMVGKLAYNGYKLRCVITDKNGNVVNTDVATLNVRAKMVITRQPVATQALTGENVSFKITASGDSLKYQWQVSKDGGSTWANSGSTGAKTATLSLTSKISFNGMMFRCVITDQYGTQVTSKAVKLTVASAMELTKQPANVTVNTGTAASFSVAAKGDGLKYQWQISKDGGATWANSGSTGATTATLSMTAKLAFNGYQFKCVVTDQYGKSVESAAATLTVNAAVKATTITKQPVDVTVATMSNATFTVGAAGDGLTYQWQISKDGGASWASSGSTGSKTASLTISARLTMNGYKVKCIVTGKDGKSVESNAVTLNVTK